MGDFYEKELAPQKSQEGIAQERAKAFEQKYINELNQKYQQILVGFGREIKVEKEKQIADVFRYLSQRLSATEGLIFGERQQIILKLKLARHFQQNNTIDKSTLYDAIIESTKFINTDRGSLNRLLKVHEQKILEKIAEIRKARAEIGDTAASNPWENLFQTPSGNYYMARLLNMPHLEEESEYMNHCVGTSDSYINQMKRGETEILSFRHAPKFNQKTQKLEGDTPLITFEYNLKTKTIEQMKKENDEHLHRDDPYFKDVIDALKQLRTTVTDTGELRDFKSISANELENIEVKDYHILTDKGEIDLRKFNPAENEFVYKMGSMEITPELSNDDVAKIVEIVVDIKCGPDEIARTPEAVNPSIRLYIGKITPDILHSDIEYMYAAFPGERVTKGRTTLGYDFNNLTAELEGKAEAEVQRALKERLIAELDGTIIDGIKSNVSDYSKDMIMHESLTMLNHPEEIDFIRLNVSALGFENGATTEQIYKRAEKLGLELLPPEFGPLYRKEYKNQPRNEWFFIAMKYIPDRDGNPRVFELGRGARGLWLSNRWVASDDEWDPWDEWCFRLRKTET